MCRYPGNCVLSRLCVEHRQWSAYKRLVLWDTLDSTAGCFHATKAETNKTVVKQFSTMSCVGRKTDDVFKLEDFKDCLHNKVSQNKYSQINHTTYK